METKVCKKCGRELPTEMFYRRDVGSRVTYVGKCKECFSADVQEAKRRRLERRYMGLGECDLLSVERDGMRLYVDLKPDNPWYQKNKSNKAALVFRDEQEDLTYRLATFRCEAAARSFLPTLALMFPEILEGALEGLETRGERDGA